MDVQNFRDLRLRQLEMQRADESYRLTQQFPKHETYRLNGQMQRAAGSIPADTAARYAIGATRQFLTYLRVPSTNLQFVRFQSTVL